MSGIYDVGSQYEGGMTYSSNYGTVGMSVLDARGSGLDDYMQRCVDDLVKRDNTVASGVIALVNNEVI